MSLEAAGRLAALVPPAIVDRSLVERSPERLHTFVRLAFQHVEPRVEFKDGRLIHVLCECLEAVTAGEIKRLVINEPPGFMKSLLVCVFWPAWEWINKPEAKSIYASYDPSLTLRDAKRTHDLLTSTWFRERWGSILRPGRQAFGDYWTVSGGNRFSTSIRGKATGRHFGKQVADDPIKPRDADGGAKFSEATLDEVNTWWDQTMSTRTSDWLALARVVVMQRLHTKDLSGHCVASGDYVHVNIPMHYTDAPCSIQVPHRCNFDWRKKVGDLAWPERCNAKAVSILEKDLKTESAISSQLEQRPTPKGGLIFDTKTFRYYHSEGASFVDPNGKPCLPPPHPEAGTFFQSWDLTFADTAGSHEVAGGALQGVKTLLYVRSATMSQMSFTQSIAAIKRMCKEFPRAHRKLIENKANGPACENVLKDKVGGIKLIEPDGGKLLRAIASTDYFESGNIVFPHPNIAPWVNEGIRQLVRFPFGDLDDFVDMLTQAVNDYFKRRNRFWDKLDQVKSS